MRKKLMIFIMALAALVLLALFLDNSVFILKDVRISGESGMEDTDVVRLAHVEFGGHMRGMDKAEIKRNIELSGTLKCIDVATELPSTLVITVERRQGRFVTDYGGNIALMDGEGYVISTTREIPEGEYLYVTGLSPASATPGRQIGAHRDRTDAMCAVLSAIDRSGCADYISELNVDSVDSLYFYSRTGIQVMLGDAENMDSKLIWMKYALMDLESRGETSGRLDVTSGTQADYSHE